MKDPTDRRTFLAGSLRTGAGVALAGVAVPKALTVATSDRLTNRLLSASKDVASPMTPVRLRVQHLPQPIGVDPDDINFAWHLDGGPRGSRQRVYRVVVWPSKDGTVPPRRPLWDSGPVTSSRQAFVAYAGPTLTADSEYRWSVAVGDGAHALGDWAEPGVFVTGLRDADWLASWLRPGPVTPGPEIYRYLRTTVRLASTPIVRVTAYVAAAHKYHLWVNGVLAATGPCFSFPDQSYYQATDLTGLLRSGATNAIGLLHHWYGAGNGRPAAEPGLLAQVSVHYADGTHDVVGTDVRWRERSAEWLPAPPRNTQAHDFIEIIDGRLAPLGWSEPDFDDSTWSTPAVLGPVGTAPFTGLFAQRTWIDEHTVEPVSVRTLPNGSVVLDFGKVYAARPKVSFHNGAEGRSLAMHAGFVLDPDGQVSTTHATQGTDMSFTYIQRDGAQEFDPYTFFGFRYLQIDAPGEEITASQVIIRARHTSMPEATPATFHSSEKKLNDVWDLCTHSCLYASHEQFVDTPTRQKGQFTWDAGNESQAIMRAYGDENQSWQGLRDFARSQASLWPDGHVSDLYPTGTTPSTIPDFSEFYVEWVWRYFQQTGDMATLANLYPLVARIADYVWSAVDPASGLVTNLPGGGPTFLYGIVDWPPEMRYGYDMTTAARTTVNVLGANALARAASMAVTLKKITPDQTNTFRERATSISNAINSQLVRADGIYIDGLASDGSQSTHASQQANAMALAYGIVPHDRVGAVGAYTASLGMAVGPDHGLELVRGLHAAGLDATIVKILTNSHVPGYANILARGGTFTWESWTPSDLLQQSMSHGWGSGALVGMHEALLGVTLNGDFTGGTESSSLTIAPPSGGVSFVEGQFPTVAGPVSVKWSWRRHGLRFSLTLPPNATAFVTLPAKNADAVTESGRPLSAVTKPTTVEAGLVRFIVGSGLYDFATVLP